jgi:transposase
MRKYPAKPSFAISLSSFSTCFFAFSNTPYYREIRQRPTLTWHSDAQALENELRTDGIFPLITNDKNLNLKEALAAYKHQPSLEKRHQQLKSYLDVRPVMLKSHTRIEAFLFLYFTGAST